MFVPAGVGGIASAVLRTKWGMLLNFPVVMSELWQRLVGAPTIFPDRVDLPTSAMAVRADCCEPDVHRGVECTYSCARGGARMNAMTDTILFENVSKFYGEVLGVNRITAVHSTPGITTLVGPNGSGKTTLMNLMTGLVQPSRGNISVLGLEPSNATEFFCNVGYCAQFDSFPRGLTGFQFVLDSLMLFGMTRRGCA